MERSYKVVVFLVYLLSVSAEHVPNIPAGGRAQYYVITNAGGYKYGYDTGDGIIAVQESNSAGSGNIGVRSGALSVNPLPATHRSHFKGANDYSDNGSGDASYSFSYDADTHNRQESSDGSGNVRGRYSYQDEAGNHDLEYVAGPETGFQVVGGSLLQPNGLVGKSASAGYQSWVDSYNQNSANTYQKSHSGNDWDTSSQGGQSDGSYNFAYNVGDHSRQESSDSTGNVKGRFSYTNEAGNHDLTYIAGAGTGFQVTGGSLATPNGLSAEANLRIASAPVSKASWSVKEAQKGWSQPAALALKSLEHSNDYDDSNGNNDASYAFGYSTDDSSRKEQSDQGGNVIGSYSYTNEDGTHDLTYIAGADTGFVATGGSLATANGLSESVNRKWAASTRSGQFQHQQNIHQNHGYDQSQYTLGSDGSSGSVGNVKGHYSYTDEAGTHDLSYVAGSDTGFQVTGGSLSIPPGLTEEQLRNTASNRAYQTNQQSNSQWNSGAHHQHHQGSTYSAKSNTAHILAKSIPLDLENIHGTKWLPVEGNPKVGYSYQVRH